MTHEAISHKPNPTAANPLMKDDDLPMFAISTSLLTRVGTQNVSSYHSDTKNARDPATKTDTSIPISMCKNATMREIFCG